MQEVGEEIVRVLEGTVPSRRVVVVRRPDAIYGFREEYWYRNEYEGEVIFEGWVSLWDRGFFATPDIAEREARATFDWLRS